jgi:hypothetical protein
MQPADRDFQSPVIDHRDAEQGAVQMKPRHLLAVRPQASRRHLFGVLSNGGDIDRTRGPVGEVAALGEDQRIDGAREVIEGVGKIRVDLDRGDAWEFGILAADRARVE